MKNVTILFLIIIILLLSSCKSEKKSENGQIGKELKINKKNLAYNYLDYTEDFSDQTWSKTKVRAIENVLESPLKRKSADLLDLSLDSLQSRIAQIVPELEGGTYAFSIYLKALPGERGNHGIAVFSKGNNGSFKSTLVNINDKDWTRAIVKVSQDDIGDIIVYPGNVQIKTSELKKVYIWGAQLEKLDNVNDDIKDYNGVRVIQ